MAVSRKNEFEAKPDVQVKLIFVVHCKYPVMGSKHLLMDACLRSDMQPEGRPATAEDRRNELFFGRARLQNDIAAIIPRTRSNFKV